MTIANGAAGARARNPLQLLLERSKLSETKLDGGKMRAGDLVSLVAWAFGMIGQIKQRADVIQFKAQRSGVANKGEPANILVRKEPSPARRARRRGQQPLLLVEADGGNLDASSPGGLSNRMHDLVSYGDLQILAGLRFELHRHLPERLAPLVARGLKLVLPPAARESGMKFSPDQLAIVRASALAFLVCAPTLVAAYVWAPTSLFGLGETASVAERLAFTLKLQLPLFLWLAGCVRAVSSGRFRSPVDIRGSAYGPPSEAIAVRAAILQNSLEQTVLAVGALLILATVLRAEELALIPALVILFMFGRITFALGYSKGPGGRAFGMALTGLSIVASLVISAGLIVAGR